MIVKKHKTPENQLILAICDEELVGKKFEDGEKQLDVSSDFYKGLTMTEEEITPLFESAYMVNAVGKKSVEICLKNGIFDKKSILRVGGVPSGQMVRF